MAFEHYIQKGTQKLRMGFTTGSCAALAAKAAAWMLLSGRPIETIDIMTPKGLPVVVPVLETVIGDGIVSCAVQKDAGDDPDVTDGTLVHAKAIKINESIIKIDGGKGVGRVTRPGLDQPIGESAINHIPRQMITSEVQAVCDSFDYEGGMSVVISIPDGIRLAKRTFNPKLGIEGGISILGTSGIVDPMSTQALIDCIGVELRALAAEGYNHVVLTPGNYGEAFLETQPFLKNAPTVKISNFVGEALDFAAASGFKSILLVGHIGKFVKLAGGIMNTHSSTADCRTELIAAHAALTGADRHTVSKLMNAISTDACIEILNKNGVMAEVLASLLRKIQEHLERRAGVGIKIGAVLFSNVYGLLGQTSTAGELIEIMKTEER
jgi:cobalt-precorrin-5B (C1)-methyltransferase